MTAHAAHHIGDGNLSQTEQATAEKVAELTRLVRAWTSGRVDLSAERDADIALVTYEALSNCVDHAYRQHGQPGAMTLHLSYDTADETIRICVTDHGRWVDPDTTAASTRGRGLLLMRALADECVVTGRDDGTTVCLHFTGCPTRNPAERYRQPANSGLSAS